MATSIGDHGKTVFPMPSGLPFWPLDNTEEKGEIGVFDEWRMRW